jgi:hypothetical protein
MLLFDAMPLSLSLKGKPTCDGMQLVGIWLNVCDKSHEEPLLSDSACRCATTQMNGVELLRKVVMVSLQRSMEAQDTADFS